MSQISEQRREQIVQTARRIVDEQGPGRLTAEAITQEVGVSRPLLYHYFANMGDLLNAVIDIYALEFEARLLNWEHDPDVRYLAASDLEGWTRSFVSMLRPDLVDDCPLLRGANPEEPSAAYPRFLSRCAAIIADHALVANDPSLAPCIGCDSPRETIYLAICGFTGMLRAFPDTSTDAAAHMLAPLWQSGASVPSAPASPAKQEEPVAAESARKGFLDWIFN